MMVDMRHYFTAFRAATLFFASAFYLLVEGNHELTTDVAIISCLLVSSMVVTYFVYASTGERFRLLIISMETMGLLFILFNTGRLSSYYIWLLLNPLLLAIYGLSLKKKRVLLVLIIGMIAVMAQVDTLHIAFGLMSVIGFAMVLSKQQEKLHLTSRTLAGQNDQLQQTLNSNEQYAQNLINMTTFLEQLSVSDSFQQALEILQLMLERWEGPAGKLMVVETGEGFHIRMYEGLQKVQIKALLELSKKRETGQFVEHALQEDQTACLTECKFDTSVVTFGIVFNAAQEAVCHDYRQQLHLMRKQFSTQISRLKLLDYQRELVISEEQNRIAGEIHDQVNQQMFAASCEVHKLKKPEKLSEEGYMSVVQSLSGLLQSMNKELRRIIYQMSSVKESHFERRDRFSKYLADLSVIYDIEIETQITDDFDTLDESVQYGVFRVVNEAIVNAVRHGSSTRVAVEVVSIGGQTRISVRDNGMGFEIEKVGPESMGIGMANMKGISETHGGSLKIDSAVGMGTTVVLEI